MTSDEKAYLHEQLEHMKGCRGKNCILPRHINPNQLPETTILSVGTRPNSQNIGISGSPNIGVINTGLTGRKSKSSGNIIRKYIIKISL